MAAVQARTSKLKENEFMCGITLVNGRQSRNRRYKGFSMVRLDIKYGMTLKDMLISEYGCKQLGV